MLSSFTLVAKAVKVFVVVVEVYFSPNYTTAHICVLLKSIFKVFPFVEVYEFHWLTWSRSSVSFFMCSVQTLRPCSCEPLREFTTRTGWERGPTGKYKLLAQELAQLWCLGTAKCDRRAGSLQTGSVTTNQGTVTQDQIKWVRGFILSLQHPPESLQLAGIHPDSKNEHHLPFLATLTQGTS